MLPIWASGDSDLSQHAEILVFEDVVVKLVGCRPVAGFSKFDQDLRLAVMQNNVLDTDLLEWFPVFHEDVSVDQ